jgi:hypothetical protein
MEMLELLFKVTEEMRTSRKRMGRRDAQEGRKVGGFGEGLDIRMKDKRTEGAHYFSHCESL